MSYPLNKEMTNGLFNKTQDADPAQGAVTGKQNYEKKLHLELFTADSSFLDNKKNDQMFIPVIRKNAQTYSAVLPESAGTRSFAKNTVFDVLEIKETSYKVRLKTLFPECPCSRFFVSAGSVLKLTEPFDLKSGSFSFPAPETVTAGQIVYSDGRLFSLEFGVPPGTFCRWILFDEACMEYRKDYSMIVMTKDASDIKIYDTPPDRYIVTAKGKLEADTRPSASEIASVVYNENDDGYTRIGPEMMQSI